MMLASQQAILLEPTHLCLPKAKISSVDHHVWCYVGSGELKSSCLKHFNDGAISLTPEILSMEACIVTGKARYPFHIKNPLDECGSSHL